MIIVWFFLVAAWISPTGGWFFLIPAVMGVVWLLGELNAVVRRRGDFIELLPDGILLVAFGGLPLCSLRIRYETIASAELKDWWSDRMARTLLRIVGRSNPPRVELRFRHRVFLWWAIWPRKSMSMRLADPQGLVSALSARLGVA